MILSTAAFKNLTPAPAGRLAIVACRFFPGHSLSV